MEERSQGPHDDMCAFMFKSAALQRVILPRSRHFWGRTGCAMFRRSSILTKRDVLTLLVLQITTRWIWMIMF